MAARKPKSLTTSMKEKNGKLAVAMISDALGLPRHDYNKVKAMLRRGEVPYDLVIDVVSNDQFVLDHFRLTYDEVMDALYGRVSTKPPKKKRGNKKVNPPASNPSKPPLPSAGGAAPTQPVSGDDIPEKPEGDGWVLSADKKKWIKEDPTKAKKKKEKKDGRDGIAKRAGKSVLGVVAAGAISTMFNTREGGLGSTILSNVQERLDRNNINNPAVGATRKGQKTGVGPKHLLAPLNDVLKTLASNQSLLLKELQKGSRGKKDKKEAVTPVPITPVPETRAASTEAADEASDYRTTLLEKLTSIDDNVKLLTKQKEHGDKGKDEKKGKGLFKRIFDMVSNFGTRIGGFLKRLPLIGSLIRGIGAAFMSLVGVLGKAGKAVWEGVTKIAGGIADKTKSLLGFGKDGADAAAKKASADAAKKAGTVAAEKAAVGAGADAAGKVAAKEGTEIAGKAAGKSLLKKIPLVGAAVGLGFAADRAMKGDWLGAGGEALSGLLSTVPGIGTAASFAVDGALAARDISKAGEITPAPSVTKEASSSVEATDADTADMKAAQESASNTVVSTNITNKGGDSPTYIPSSLGNTSDSSGNFMDRMMRFG